MLRVKYYAGVGIIGLILSFLLIFSCRHLLLIKEGNIKVTIKYKPARAEDLTVYWDDGSHFSQDKHKTHKTDTVLRDYIFEIRQPHFISELRIDPADTFSSATIYEVEISGTKVPYTVNRFDTFQTSGLNVVKSTNGYILTRKPGNFDPNIIIPIPDKNRIAFPVYSFMDTLVIIFCILLAFIFVFIIVKNKIWFTILYHTPFTTQVLIFGFLGIISSYWTNHFFNYYIPPPSLENRKLAQKPHLDTIKYNPDYYFAAFNSWFSDYFPFRQKIVHFNTVLKIDLLHVSPMPDQVIIGKDFQFFTANSFVQDDFMGKKIFTEGELNLINYALESKRKYLKAKGIDFYLVIPPAKQTVYNKFMPDIYLARESNFKLWQQVRNRLLLDSAEFYVNVADTLINYYKLHPEKKVFYQYDIHWSEWGAFKAYQVVMDRICKDHPEFGKPLQEDEIKIDTFYDTQADLAKLVVLNKTLKREMYLISPIKKDSIKETTENYNFVPIFIYHNPSGKGRILVFRDSYSEQWKWLIAHHFNESIFIWDYKMSTKLIKKYKPDIVLQENAEMLILYLFEQLIIDKDA